MENKDSDKHIGIDEFIKLFFDEKDRYSLFEQEVLVHNVNGYRIDVTHWKAEGPPVLILKDVECFDEKRGELTIQGKKIRGDDLMGKYFARESGNSVISNFFYRKKEDNGLYPVKFIFKKNDFKGFNVYMLDESLCVFEGNVVMGTISGLRITTMKLHEEFWGNNKLKDGAEVGFWNCTFVNETLKNRTITQLERTSVTEKLIFKNCTIKKTDFNFSGTPIVQFLAGNTIEELINVEENIKVSLNKDTGIGELFFSNDIKIGEKNSPEERQYFFRQIQKFQERDGEVVQAKFAYKKFLEEELELENLTLSDKLIIGFSKVFGGGISYLKPLFFLLFTFIALSCFYKEFNLSVLLAVFPNVFFAKENIDSLSNHYPHLHINIIQVILLYCYFLLLVSWYFLIKSLHKFTYKK